MNNAQIESIITKIIVGALAAVAAKWGIGTDALTEAVTDIVAGVGILGTLLFSHWFNSVPSGTSSKTSVPKVPLFMIGTALGLIGLTSGCTTVYTNGCVTTVQTRFFGADIEATTTSTGTPKVVLGAGSSLVTIYPTSTNALYCAPFFSTAQANTGWNPLDVGINETLGAGNVAANIGTNGTSEASAVVPTTNVQLKAKPTNLTP